MNSDALTHGLNPSEIPRESKTTEETNNQTSSEISLETGIQIQQETLHGTGVQSAAVTVCEIDGTPDTNGSQKLSETPCEMVSNTIGKSYEIGTQSSKTPCATGGQKCSDMLSEKEIHDLSSQEMQCETSSQNSQEMSCEKETNDTRSQEMLCDTSSQSSQEMPCENDTRSETGSQDLEACEIKVKTEIKEEPVSDNENFQASVRNLEMQIKSEPSNGETQPSSSIPVIKEEALKENVCKVQCLESQILTIAKQGFIQSYSYRNHSVVPGIVNRKYPTKRLKGRYSWINRQGRTNNSNNSPVSPCSVESNEVYFCLIISNFPTGWSGLQVKNYVGKECGPVDKFEIISDAEMNFTGSVQLKFSRLTDCMDTKNKLNGKEVEGQTLTAVMIVSDSDEDSDSEVESEEPQRKRKKVNKERPWKPEIDVWETDPRGLYGFKPRFLQSLGITPPVGKWVNVTNFRCGKTELQEVMQLAGEVMFCNIVVTGSQQKYAKVMYSHPLEAVQAVSMINNQVFYGLPLNVKMDVRQMCDFILPKGLNAVGPGLGTTGKPLRDIVRQYERYAKGRSSQINSVLFRSTDEIFASNEGNVCNSPLNQTIVSQSQILQANSMNQADVTPFEQSNSPIPGPSIITPVISPQVAGPSGLSGCVGPIRLPGIPGTNIAPKRPMAPSAPMVATNFGPRQVISQNVTTSNYRPQNVRPVNLGPQNVPTNIGPRIVTPLNHGPQNIRPLNPGPPLARPVRPPNVTLEISNIPLSTTFSMLSDKMSVCGHLISLQLTSPGCAVVQYSKSSEAERCYEQYNKCCVQGNIVRVKFI